MNTASFVSSSGTVMQIAVGRARPPVSRPAFKGDSRMLAWGTTACSNRSAHVKQETHTT
jgi:hypothetical protein